MSEDRIVDCHNHKPTDCQDPNGNETKKMDPNMQEQIQQVAEKLKTIGDLMDQEYHLSRIFPWTAFLGNWRCLFYLEIDRRVLLMQLVAMVISELQS